MSKNTMAGLSRILVLLVFGLFSVESVCVADDLLDPKRPYMDDLKEDTQVDFDEYIYPYLITQTATTSSQSVDQVVRRLRKHLRQKAIPLRGRFSKKGGTTKVTVKSVPMPKEVTSGDQLEAIEECTAKYCKMKLNTKQEKPVVEKAKNKVQAYHNLVLQRVRQYRNQKSILGYEEVWDNHPAQRLMVTYLNFLERDYPRCVGFVETGLWKKSKARCQPKDSFFRQEIVMMKLDQLQPIWRISEVVEFTERGRALFFEVHVYTNHYFDSSARVYEVFSLNTKPKKTALVITDIMDIDTLKLSSMARFFYKGKMASTVIKFQKDETKQILK